LGVTGFELDVRFPGQYLDKETNLFYNYFRDYDPQTGRYVQSDPIGLDGGINPYLYVRANPLSRVDPLGLLGDDPGSDLFPGVDPTPSPTPGSAIQPQFGPPTSLNIAVPAISGAAGQVVAVMVYGSATVIGGVGLTSLTPQQLAAMCFAALSGLGQLNKLSGFSRAPITPPPMSASGAAKTLQEIKRASEAANRSTSGFSRPLTGAAMSAPAACTSQCDSR
jgi:RHS repeat-associated protein